MSEHRSLDLRGSLEEHDAALPAGPDYTGEPCPVCGRIRVYLRRDGQYQCEKCESIVPASPLPGKGL